MLVIFGERLYGRVDNTPDGLHVATNFVHLYYFPLLPTRSYVVRPAGFGEAGLTPIGLNAKSAFAAWGRAACWVVGLVAGPLAYGPATRGEPVGEWFRSGASFATAAVLLVLSYTLPAVWRATAGRAEALRRVPGPSGAGRAAVVGGDGRPTATGFDVIPVGRRGGGGGPTPAPSWFRIDGVDPRTGGPASQVVHAADAEAARAAGEASGIRVQAVRPVTS